MRRREFLFSALAAAAAKPVLEPENFRHYIEQFNRDDKEDVAGSIHNADAWTWMKSNIPFFACPDQDIELTYYYRWWAYRKHIENTPAGFILTEFLKPVKHATTYNAISCAAGLHISEGRWLRDPRYLDDYIRFWLRGGRRRRLAGALSPVQRLDLGRGLRPMAGRRAHASNDRAARCATDRLSRLGAGEAGCERALLAARRFRRHGELD